MLESVAVPGREGVMGREPKPQAGSAPAGSDAPLQRVTQDHDGSVPPQWLREAEHQALAERVDRLDQLATRILAFQYRFNATAKPFDWTYTRNYLTRLRRYDTPPLPQAA